MHFTQNPIGSDDQLDLQDNAISFDYAMNSPAALWQDRFGKQHKTVQQALKDVGFKPAGFDFVSGGTLGLGDRDKCVFYPTDGYWYSWNGQLPYVVTANSSPTPGGKKGWGVVTRDERVIAREALSRTYQEAGYNLVEGSFEAGGTLVNVNDVLLQERTGKVFSGPVGTVAAGTVPASGEFVDVSNSVYESGRNGHIDLWGAVKSTSINSNAAKDACWGFSHKKEIPARFGDGYYLITTGYTVDTDAKNTGLMLYGNGSYSSRVSFKPTDSTDTFLKIHKPTSGQAVYGAALKGLAITGVENSYNGMGVDLRRVVYTSLDDLIIRYFDVGLKLDECFGTKYNNIQVAGCRIDVDISTSQNNANTFTNLQVYTAGEIGLFSRGSTQVGFNGLVCEGNPIGVQLRGQNDGISFEGSYFENNAIHMDIGGGSTSTISYSSLYRMNNGNIAYKLTNSGTQAALELTSNSDVFKANADNVTLNLFDFTSAAGSDDIRLSIRNPKFIKRPGTVINHWVSNGSLYLPPAHYFIHSDIPIRDLASLTVTIGSITQNRNTKVYALENDRLSLKLDITIVSTVLDASQSPNRWNARFTIDSGAAPSVRSIVPIVVYSGSVFSAKSGVLIIDTTGVVTMSFLENVAGLNLCAEIVVPR